MSMVHSGLKASIPTEQDEMMTSQWQPIETAPKDAVVLLFGLLVPHADDRHLHSALDQPKRFTGYWDEIDDAWCPVGSTWTGPWIEPTHWMPLPGPPVVQGTSPSTCGTKRSGVNQA